jgi:hypothetical protein
MELDVYNSIMQNVLAPRTKPRRKTWEFNDGGRKAAGFKGQTGDCVCRAISIASGLDYKAVYKELNYRISMELTSSTSSARTGVGRYVYQPYLEELGFSWVPTMKVGQGTTVHLVADELPSGMIIARLSKHLCAVKDGVVQDTGDPSREGTRCVYGYFQKS